MFRYSDVQDKWTIEILRLFDGDRIKHRQYSEIRMTNFTRTITQLKLFGDCESIYKYKFLEFLIPFYYKAVQITTEEVNKINIQKVKEIEVYTYKQLLYFMFSNEREERDATFKQKATQVIKEIILGEKYKGVLKDHELIIVFLEEVLKMDSKKMQELFAEILQEYYFTMKDKQIHRLLSIKKIKEYIKNYRAIKERGKKITMEMVFGEQHVM